LLYRWFSTGRFLEQKGVPTLASYCACILPWDASAMIQGCQAEGAPPRRLIRVLESTAIRARGDVWGNSHVPALLVSTTGVFRGSRGRDAASKKFKCPTLADLTAAAVRGAGWQAAVAVPRTPLALARVLRM
jgi:hypothetical protein